MHATTTTSTHPGRAASAWQWRWGRRALYATIAVIVFVAVLIGAAFLIDEPLRRHMEAQLNHTMTGYTVRLPELDFHPFGFSLTLRGLRVSQNAHPDPPVLSIDALDASVHWRALLHLRLVADFEFTRPRIYVNRPQLQQEVRDSVPVEDKGWQEALEDIYPLKINELRVVDGTVTYVEKDPKEALQITRANFRATNIRNVASPDRTYPSPYHLDAVIFENGRIVVDGNANFLAKPQPTSAGNIDLHDVPLLRLKPVTTLANVHVSSGILDATGDFEVTDKKQRVELRDVVIDKLAVDYVHAPETALAEEQRLDKAEAVAEKTADHPTADLRVDRFRLRNATLGYVDETVDPHYRIYLADTDAELRDFSNQPEAGPSHLQLSSKFMGSGDTHFDATFLPQREPDLSMALRVENTAMKSMNDLFRAYGNFDVVAGSFSLYTELKIKDGHIDGYIKPLFTDIDVYDRAQDAGKPILKQIYEGLVGGIGELLENRRDDVATEADVKGSTKSPRLSTWQVIVNLVRNGFFRAILPGFEESVRRARQ